MESTRKLIAIFNGQKPCTRIIYGILHSFLHFSRAKDVISHLLWEPEKMNVKFHKITSYTRSFRILTMFSQFL